MGFFYEIGLVKLAGRPLVQHRLVGVIEHLHADGQMRSGLRKRFDDFQLNGVVVRVRMAFSHIDHPGIGQVGDQSFLGHHRQRGRLQDGMFHQTGRIVLDGERLRRHGTSTDAKHDQRDNRQHLPPIGQPLFRVRLFSIAKWAHLEARSGGMRESEI